LSLPTTPSQTVGPFFAIALPWGGGPLAVAQDAPGAIRIEGSVYDGAGARVPDSLIETWQADPRGRFADAHGHGGPSALAGFRGFARCGGEQGDGSFQIRTVKPGPLPGPEGSRQAPHIDVSIFARGLLQRCVTRIYFADEHAANALDPVLMSVPTARRSTLLAEPIEGGYRFDVHLQGLNETVFFAL
jgi:protocatechuate 3,4-dioxygenase, alpha subunit